MPEIILNAAGFTRTTGTANPTITGDTGKSGSFSDIATGTEVAYYRRYSSNKAGFENGIGIWREVAAAGSIGYIERTSVEKSSNDNEAVVWGVGEQIIDVTITPDMIVADDDERLLTVEPGELGTVAELDGTEAWIALKDGDGVDVTSGQVLGTPFLQKSGFKFLDPTLEADTHRIREYSDFSRIRPAYTSTSGAPLDLEPYLITQSGTGAKAAQSADTTLLQPGLALTTGTDTNGYVIAQHMYGPIAYFEGTSNYDMRAEVKLVDLPTAGEAYTFSAGFFVLGAAPATTQFIGLVASYGLGANWAQMVKDASGQTTPGTSGVALQTATSTVIRVWYDHATAKTRFFINGVEVPGITDAVRAMDPLSLVRAGFILQKTAGTTSRTVHIYRHSIDILWPEIPHF